MSNELEMCTRLQIDNLTGFLMALIKQSPSNSLFVHDCVIDKCKDKTLKIQREDELFGYRLVVDDA